MKVVLQTTVLDRIREDIRKADQTGRRVDYIAVTQDEYNDLRSDVRVRGLMTNAWDFPSYSASMAEATFHTRDFEKRSGYIGQSRMRFASREQLYGSPLFVVPQEYHPL